VIANSLTVRGTLRARSSCVNVQVSGNFKTEVVSNSAATVDVRNANGAGDGVTVTCGSATINGRDVIANGASGGNFGGDIVITCSEHRPRLSLRRQWQRRLRVRRGHHGGRRR
jgi:hypothetical protein